MARRRTRRTPSFDGRWLIGLLAVAAVVLIIRAVPEPVPEPPLQLVALSPDGSFRDTLTVPESWRDTSVVEEGHVRVPLVLGVRNTGERSGQPERLALSLPARYRLVHPGRELEAELAAGSPLVTYAVATGLAPVRPGRLPTLLPSLDTVWLEVVLPTYYCVTVGDSVPELIPARPPSPAALSEVRIFYSFEGGDLTERQTGTLTVHLDTALLQMPTPAPGPSAPVVLDPTLATPELGELRNGGSRSSDCGDPQDPMVIRSTVWLTEEGGRVIALEYGGATRKRLYDLDSDGVIERESWDADGDGVFEATRRVRLPLPGFLLPVSLGAAPDSAPDP